MHQHRRAFVCDEWLSMSNPYQDINSNQLKSRALKPDYDNNVVTLKTGKGKKQIQRIQKMENYRNSHLPLEDLWFKRFGITKEQGKKYLNAA